MPSVSLGEGRVKRPCQRQVSTFSSDIAYSEPRGFEGFVRGWRAPRPAQRGRRARSKGARCDVEPRAAGSPTSGCPNKDEHLVVCVPETLRLQANFSNTSACSIKNRTTFSRPRIGPCATRLSGIHSPLGWASSVEGFHVAGVHRAVELPHDLHVLLRHRLLRKPGGFEGLGPPRDELQSLVYCRSPERPIRGNGRGPQRAFRSSPRWPGRCTATTTLSPASMSLLREQPSRSSKVGELHPHPVSRISPAST